MKIPLLPQPPHASHRIASHCIDFAEWSSVAMFIQEGRDDFLRRIGTVW